MINACFNGRQVTSVQRSLVAGQNLLHQSVGVALQKTRCFSDPLRTTGKLSHQPLNHRFGSSTPSHGDRGMSLNVLGGLSSSDPLVLASSLNERSFSVFAIQRCPACGSPIESKTQSRKFIGSWVTEDFVPNSTRRETSSGARTPSGVQVFCSVYGHDHVIGFGCPRHTNRFLNIRVASLLKAGIVAAL